MLCCPAVLERILRGSLAAHRRPMPRIHPGPHLLEAPRLLRTLGWGWAERTLSLAPLCTLSYGVVLEVGHAAG